jgi:hypothetical protein
LGAFQAAKSLAAHADWAFRAKSRKRQHFASSNLIVAIEGIEAVKRFDRKAMSRGSLHKDIEAQSQSTVEEYLDGFADVSAYIGSDRELALFRRFDVLGARNLLYLQARLVLLEAKLEKYDEEDRQIVKDNSEVDDKRGIKPSGSESPAWEILLAAKDWGFFESRAAKETQDGENSGKNGDGEGRHRRRMNTVIEIQEALKQYRALRQ